jgi:hypothetical protein
MFGKLRSPSGGGSLLLMGIALLALAGVLLVTPLPRETGVALAIGCGLAGAALGAVWWRREQEAKYDLGRLFDTPPADRHAPEEPYQDTVDANASPYCGYCDEVYAPGTYRCERCGRGL